MSGSARNAPSLAVAVRRHPDTNTHCAFRLGCSSLSSFVSLVYPGSEAVPLLPCTPHHHSSYLSLVSLLDHRSKSRARGAFSFQNAGHGLWVTGTANMGSWRMLVDNGGTFCSHVKLASRLDTALTFDPLGAIAFARNILSRPQLERWGTWTLIGRLRSSPQLGV